MLLKDIWLDVKAVQERDPAARSALEVLLLYQGVHALIWHRIATGSGPQYAVPRSSDLPDRQIFHSDRDPSGRGPGTWDPHRPRLRHRHRRDHGVGITARSTRA